MQAVVREHRRGILVDGMPVLQGLLVKFSSGATAHSGATMGNQPAVAAALIAMVQVGKEVPFLKRLFDAIDKGIADQGYIRLGFDYDGQGPFFKTSVEVTDLGNEAYVPDEVAEPYLLGLNAAYVGSGVEDGLAAAVGWKQGLSRCEVELTLPASGDMAVIDLASVLDPVRGLLDMPTSQDIVFAKAMMPSDGTGGLNSVILARADCEYKVTLGVDCLSLLPGYKKEQKFTRKGAVITALRRAGWEEGRKHEMAPLRFNFSVASTNQWRGNDWMPMPVLRPRIIGDMQALTQRIAKSYPD